MSQVSIRTTEVIAIEINAIKDQTKRIFLSASIEIGRRLVEAKGMVKHGEWGIWLKDTVDYSQSTANNLMKVFEEYGSDQLSLFGGDAKSQAFEKLSYSQAVALLVLPGEEREQFIEENQVEDMSTRDLQAAIKERQEAVEKAEAAEKAKAAAEKAAAKAEKTAEQERKVKEKLETQQKDHAIIVQRLQEKLDAVQAASASGDDGAAAEAEEAAEQLRGELAKSDEQLIESQRRVKELEEALKAKPVEVATATTTVFETPPEVLAELEALRKKAASDTGEETALFKAHAKGLGDSFNAALGVISKLTTKDVEVAKKCVAILLSSIDLMPKMLQAATRTESE